MNISDYKIIYTLSCIAIALIILFPTLATVIRLPEGEHFSELWLLGPSHKAEGYPFNVVSNATYNVTLGIGNRMRGLQYYVVYLKFRNQTEPLPNATTMTPSAMKPFYEYRAFLSDEETWESQVVFGLKDVGFEGNLCRIQKMDIGTEIISVDKVATWDQTNHGFYFQLFFELWIYNATEPGLQFHNRFVGIWLNATKS